MGSPQSGRIIIDPTGDALITLENPRTIFALWTEPLGAAGDSEDISTGDTSEGISYEDEDDGEELPNWMKWDETDVEHDEEEQPKQQDESSVLSTSEAKSQKSSLHPTIIDSIEPAVPLAVVYQVSSAHLITASPKFKSELQSLIHNQKDDNGHYRLDCSNWDPEAFEIFLNTLHTRYRRVTKQLSLEMLAKVAVMIEHYQCWEAFELISQTWIKHVRMCHPMPSTYSRDLMLWMQVAWVFKLPKEFTRTTTIALHQSTESSIPEMGLGIPPSILRTLEGRRSETVEQIIETFNYWIDEFSDTYTCRVDAELSFECSSILLGALMKQMRNIGVLSPRVVAPFDGLSLEKVHESISSMQSPIWETYDEVNELYPIKHACGFQGTIIRDVEHVVASAKGLMLDDFVDWDETTQELSFDCP